MKRLLILGLCAAPLLSGCSSAGSTLDSALGSATTAGVGAGVASATGSALIGIGAGIGAGIGLDQALKYAERKIAGNVQNAVAETGGPLAPGQSAYWTVPHLLPLSGKAGTVEAVRDFGNAIPCKDLVFTVGDEPDFYVTTVCKNKHGHWRWALAEPTVDRWSGLQ